MLVVATLGISTRVMGTGLTAFQGKEGNQDAPFFNGRMVDFVRSFPFVRRHLVSPE